MSEKEVYYDNEFTEEQTIRAQIILENVQSSIMGKDLLDLGIGDGICFDALKTLPRSYDIVDASEELIELKKNSLEPDMWGRINFFLAYFEEFTTGKKYDCILMANIIEHVDDPCLVLRRYKGFLKSGGKIFLDVPNGNVLNRQIAVHAGLLDSATQLTENDIRFGHKRVYLIDSITALVEDCGYRVLKTTGVFLKPITSAQMRDIGFSNNIYKALGLLGKKYPDLANTVLLEIQPI